MPESSRNSGYQNYTTSSTPVYSYLEKTDNGYMRVEYVGNGVIVVEEYDYSYNLIEQKYIEGELSYFGGFYAGENAYYFVFGQRNLNEDDSKEVIRIVAYSKAWERIGETSLYGANTYIPFSAGSCRMTEYGGYLL